jgi:thiazolinyl imide reductase
VGLLAKGSERSKECAKHYGVNLYTDIGQLPDTIELACVILRSGSMGGHGANLSLQLLERGIHVIQEQPIHYKELASCLRTARQNDLHFRISNLYVQLPAVRRFIACAREMLAKQDALYLDATFAIQVSYPMMRILSEALPTIRPWKISNVIKDNGPFQVVSGILGNIPVTLRVHNEIDPKDPDNHLHLLHCFTIGVEGGRLSLIDTHGPLVWHPRLHVAYSHNLFNDLLTAAPAHLNEANTHMLGSADSMSYRDIFMKQWPSAIGRELSAIREMIQGNGNMGAASAQQELLGAELWHYLTDALGYAVLRSNCKHQPLSADILKEAALKIVEEDPQEYSDHISSPKIERRDIFKCTEDAESEIQGIDPMQIKAFVERMDEAVLSSMLFALQSQGTLKNREHEYSRDEILAASKAAPRHRHLILRWLRELTKYGYLQQRGEYYLPTNLMTLDLIDQRWKLVRDVWDNKLGSPSGLDYLMSNVEQLPQLITDNRQAALILFPEGRMDDFAEPLYGDTIYARYLNKSVAEAVVRIAARKQALINASAKDSLTILEIGAGTGATTKVVAPRLKTYVSESLKLNYLFTDISHFFLSPARKHFKDYPWMRFKIFDMEQDFFEQGLKSGSVDIVIAAGVLNNARDIDKVIQGLMEILAPGGWMLILEPAQEFLEILISQAFMMTPPEDSRKDTKTTFMSLKQWMDVFYQANAKEVVALPEEEHLLAPFGQKLFIVQKG